MSETQDKNVVVLVDSQGRLLSKPDGSLLTMEKIEAHRSGVLHLAVSIYIFNEKGCLLLQKRADQKYHSPGLWTNSCCTHPYPGESAVSSARRRLKEEMGLDCDLSEAFTVLYRADVGGGLTENEYDHVFFGYSIADPQPDIHEVSDWKWKDLIELEKDLEAHPDKYTAWFRIIFPRVLSFL